MASEKKTRPQASPAKNSSATAQSQGSMLKRRAEQAGSSDVSVSEGQQPRPKKARAKIEYKYGDFPTIRQIIEGHKAPKEEQLSYYVGLLGNMRKVWPLDRLSRAGIPEAE